ncbi:DsbA family oxidoreductase [Ketogulonicigenium vulgare]|uniref:Predicted dithiol-disulfide isomerase involved in polyketide biosynthesis n=1 Tax=Ketogulonicigenium vulgare (strain WSH-001) TaxID=759362 RepID=F9Y6N4_KETVW|nr:DsbA family oxidoreductase [Ketogulonicigenium vulgare]ADO43896.1 DsbA oxidoreductase [Ketogulonicigenium vulgare Y25]AEM42154.1 predicted dithiol-disulfide isomerase involved in polyketide biosynthesis [Ketogulonicigenium vulgare WSH-001]ALJ79778.1 disulfide isomerase [Ketogulonicigenium vulgare]ANW32698.1 disulfide isomerase [Ketogulonicigenium vulgare]AOZ55930.1 DsbA oxidoreductase [Ketogulonicigenium vulgare]
MADDVMPSDVMKVEIWSDVICPWCWIGKARFEKALAAFPHAGRVEVTHHAYRLDPGGKPEEVVTSLGRKYGGGPDQIRQMMGRVVDAAAGEGLVYNTEGAKTGDTTDAHRIIKFARDKGLGDLALDRLYAAYFTDGIHVVERAALLDLASEIGLDRGEVQSMLTSDAYIADVTADQAQAQRFGANGVPFFVIDGKYGISGAQEPALFARALDQIWAESGRTALKSFGDANADACGPDGCAI